MSTEITTRGCFPSAYLELSEVVVEHDDARAPVVPRRVDLVGARRELRWVDGVRRLGDDTVAISGSSHHRRDRDAILLERVRDACPGPGACSCQYDRLSPRDIALAVRIEEKCVGELA